MTTTDPYDPLQRIADRLDAIDATLGMLLQIMRPISEAALKLANPPMMVEPTSELLDAGVPSARIYDPGPDNTTATQGHQNGTHNRRRGDKLYASGPQVSPQRLGDPNAQLDPWVRPVPAIREEEPDGEKANAQPGRG